MRSDGAKYFGGNATQGSYHFDTESNYCHISPYNQVLDSNKFGASFGYIRRCMLGGTCEHITFCGSRSVLTDNYTGNASRANTTRLLGVRGMEPITIYTVTIIVHMYIHLFQYIYQL